MQDNEEKQLYAALKSYASLTESTDGETMKNFAKHVVSVVVEAEGETEKVEHKLKDKHSCGQCDSYKEEITKLLATVTEIVKKQEEDRQNNNLNDAETKAKIQTLVEHNDKMAAEIESLKANVEETTGDNKLIKHVLDIKQGEWTKVYQKKISREEEKSATTGNSIINQNRFQYLSFEDIANNIPNLEEYEIEQTSNSVNRQMSTYRERNRRKYENSKVNPKAKKISKKTQRHSTDKDNSTISTPRTQGRQEKSVLVIGDSMVKNIDDRKLERAARAKTVCHSYSGATVKQIEEKIDQYWNENQQYEKVILHVGTNDLARQEPNEVAENMEALVSKMKTHAKEIAVSSVVKRYDNKVKPSSIMQYNNLSHELCIKHKIAYIDNNCIDKPLLNRSNLHLNRNGDKALGSAFCAYLKPKTATRMPVSSTMNSENFFWPAQRHQMRDWTKYLRYVHQVLHQ